MDNHAQTNPVTRAHHLPHNHLSPQAHPLHRRRNHQGHISSYTPWPPELIKHKYQVERVITNDAGNNLCEEINLASSSARWPAHLLYLNHVQMVQDLQISECESKAQAKSDTLRLPWCRWPCKSQGWLSRNYHPCLMNHKAKDCNRWLPIDDLPSLSNSWMNCAKVGLSLVVTSGMVATTKQEKSMQSMLMRSKCNQQARYNELHMKR